MDLHRLRIVEFDTSVSEKEGEKKYLAEHKGCKQEDWKTSTDGNKDETRDDDQCLDDNTSPPGLSKKCLDDKISPPGTSKKCLNDTASPPRTSKKCPDDKICPPGTSEKYLDDTHRNLKNNTTSTSPPGTSKTDNFASRKSKSEIFKIPPKNKPRKRDLKINSSDIGLIKLFRDSAHLHQKKRTFNLRNRNSRLHHKVENVKEKKEKNEEVHFLFTRETPSFINYCKRRAKNERTTTQKKRDSELPNDIYGFQTSTRSMDQHQYRMSCSNFIDTDKILFKKLRRSLCKPRPPHPVESATNCACKHHAMRVLNSPHDSVQSPSIYYNLRSYPQYPQRSRTKHVKYQDEGIGRGLSCCTAKDAKVEVSPSSLECVPKYCCDAVTCPSKVELSAVCCRRSPCALNSPLLGNCTIRSMCNQKTSPLPCCTPKPCAAPSQNKSKTKCNEMKKIKLLINFPLEFISRFSRLVTGFQTKKKLTGDCCIKYVFIILLIVVWSPCLLAVFLVWVVMFPVKLTEVLKMDMCSKKDPRCEYKRKSSENCLPKNKKSVMTSATNWYSRTVGTVANTLTSLFRLKKKSATGAASSYLPSCHPNQKSPTCAASSYLPSCHPNQKSPTCAASSFSPSCHPNPRNRYTLFYADNRGWVMKPLRCRNTRPSARTRAVQNMRCDVRPKLRCPQELKELCPDNSYIWHKSNARSLRYTNPRPKCNCWNKYLQCSSMFSRLESRDHRCQQRNSPGLGWTGTAEGGVQQPYPDIMCVPGRNHQPCTKKNPKSPTKCDCGPRFSNPANKCASKLSCCKSLLRRACKRRPLRCTPPTEHLPRVCCQAIKRKAYKKKACAARRTKRFCKCLRVIIKQTDRAAWPAKNTCPPMWIDALRNKPCFCIYRMCPRLYPAFLKFYKQQKSCCQMFVYFLTFCFWSPLVLCGYFCCNFIRTWCW